MLRYELDKVRAGRSGCLKGQSAYRNPRLDRTAMASMVPRTPSLLTGWLADRVARHRIVREESGTHLWEPAVRALLRSLGERDDAQQAA